MATVELVTAPEASRLFTEGDFARFVAVVAGCIQRHGVQKQVLYHHKADHADGFTLLVRITCAQGEVNCNVDTLHQELLSDINTLCREATSAAQAATVPPGRSATVPFFAYLASLYLEVNMLPIASSNRYLVGLRE